MVLLFNSHLYSSRVHLGPSDRVLFKVIHVFGNGGVELENKDKTIFKVNRKRLKIYLRVDPRVALIIIVYLVDT